MGTEVGWEEAVFNETGHLCLSGSIQYPGLQREAGPMDSSKASLPSGFLLMVRRGQQGVGEDFLFCQVPPFRLSVHVTTLQQVPVPVRLHISIDAPAKLTCFPQTRRPYYSWFRRCNLLLLNLK